MLTPATCRAARALIDMSQSDLAGAARVGVSTVRNFEAGRYLPRPNNLDAMEKVLTDAGVIFILEGGASLTGGAGARLSLTFSTKDS